MADRKLGLVVLNYNNYSETITFLNKISNYSVISEIVVVDNCSTNESFDVLLTYATDKVYIIQSKKNGGYGYGNNIGIKYGIKHFNWNFVIISNPDVFFEEKTIDSLLECFDSMNRLKVGLIAPKMVMPQKSTGVLTHWKLPTYKDDFLKSFFIINALYRKFKRKERSQLEVYQHVDVLPGSFLFSSIEALQDVEFFSEKTFLYCEERILTKKLMDKGYQNILLTNDSYLHSHSTTISKYNSKISQFKIYNQSILVYHRYYAGTSKLKVFLLSLALSVGLLGKRILFKIDSLRRRK